MCGRYFLGHDTWDAAFARILQTLRERGEDLEQVFFRITEGTGEPDAGPGDTGDAGNPGDAPEGGQTADRPEGGAV